MRRSAPAATPPRTSAASPATGDQLLRLSLPAYRLFPYERDLAERELEALDLRLVDASANGFVVDAAASHADLRRLTYVAGVHDRAGPVLRPDLAVMEAVHRELRGRGPRRQATRYRLHGIHEYKGKFNPQVVRAFANLVRLRPGDWLIDPFCGSGTALLEGAALGANVLGIDLSPMAAFISRAKLTAARAPAPLDIAGELADWMRRWVPRIAAAQHGATPDPDGLDHLDGASRRYLEQWFTAPALAALSTALAARTGLSAVGRPLADVAISSLCRAVSLQEPGDLRGRRRRPGFVAPPVAPLLERAVGDLVLSLREVATGPPPPPFEAHVVRGRASDPSSYAALSAAAPRRVAICSPPYATALPYIDTDRLSLLLLGLARAAHIRDLERSLTGSREWKAAERGRWSAALASDASGLPPEIVALCREVERAGRAHGFRRRAVAPLLYRYFHDMRAALRQLRTVLRDGDEAVLIVGANRTSGPDGPIVVETPLLLGAVAEQASFRVKELVALETWPRFGLHRANGIDSESALWLAVAD
jgi:SAM-dependent methyltransferase